MYTTITDVEAAVHERDVRVRRSERHAVAKGIRQASSRFDGILIEDAGTFLRAIADSLEEDEA